MAIEEFRELCKVSERPGQTIDLVDDHSVDRPSRDVIE